jgi:hypothetical protein
MIVTLSDSNGNNVYLKYYPDVDVKVGCLLGIPNINQHISTSSAINHVMATAMASIIPNYTLFLTDKTASDNWYSYIVNNFTDAGQNNYSNLFASLSTDFINQVKTIFASTSANLVTQNYNTISIPCSSV